MVSVVLIKAGSTVRSRAMLCKELLKAVLLYRRNIWVITESIMNVLEVFHHCFTQRILVKTARRVMEEG